MTTCPDFFTFSWPLRGRGGDNPSGQPDRFFPGFFNISQYYQSNVTNLMWPLNTGGDDTDENDKDDDDDDEMLGW